MLEKSVVERCCGEVLEKSLGGRLLEKSDEEECCREIVVEKCWLRVL